MSGKKILDCLISSILRGSFWPHVVLTKDTDGAIHEYRAFPADFHLSINGVDTVTFAVLDKDDKELETVEVYLDEIISIKKVEGQKND